jgi:hypothetical protein
MSLVTLIQKLDKVDRSAVVVIEGNLLPAAAKATGKVDEEGRAIFSLFEKDWPKVETDVKAEANTVVSTVKADEKTAANTAESFVDKVEDEAKKLEADALALLHETENKISGLFHKKS